MSSIVKKRKFRPFFGRVLLVRTGAAVGDALLLTCVSEEIRRQRPEIKVIAVSAHPELYQNNPSIYGSFHLPSWFPSRIAKYLRLPGLYFLGYEFNNFFPREHLAAAFCLSAGLIPSRTPRPRIYLTEEEMRQTMDSFSLPASYLAIQSSAGSSWAASNKNWQSVKWQDVVDRLHCKFKFVQVGLISDPLLSNVTDLRGKTSLREFAAIIAGSACFIGQEGGGHHVAAAVDTPAVLVFSGYILPETTSYPGNIDIYRGAECAPCWLTTPCPHDKKCMDAITVDEVAAAVEKSIANSLSNH